MLIGARLQRAPEARTETIRVAASLARTATAVLLCCLCVAQPGWILPARVVGLGSLPAIATLFALASRSERLSR